MLPLFRNWSKVFWCVSLPCCHCSLWAGGRLMFKQNICQTKHFGSNAFLRTQKYKTIQKIPVVSVRAPITTNLKACQALSRSTKYFYRPWNKKFFFPKRTLWIIFVPLVLAVFLLVRAGNQSFCPARRYTNRTFPPCIDILFLPRFHSGLMYILPCCIFMQD